MLLTFPNFGYAIVKSTPLKGNYARRAASLTVRLNASARSGESRRDARLRRPICVPGLCVERLFWVLLR
jgi:hypothetical protein